MKLLFVFSLFLLAGCETLEQDAASRSCAPETLPRLQALRDVCVMTTTASMATAATYCAQRAVVVVCPKRSAGARP